MSFALLVFSNFKRHKTRTILTIFSIIVAFVLFGYLAAIRKAFDMGVSVAGADRLVVRHRVSIIQLLPASYEQRIEQIDAIADAVPFTWFGGIYRNERTMFPQMATDPEEYLNLYPEILLGRDQLETWKRTKTGVVVGRKLAERYEWKIGDKIPLRGTIWPLKSGGDTWTFDLVGIYEGAKKETDLTQFLLRQDYLQESNRWGEGRVGWYIIRIEDPARADELARKVDATFLNSPDETKTEPEGAFIKAWADQVGNIGAIVTAILTAVFFTILLVAGNTMAQAVRERTSELGVLKAIGFGDGQVLTLVLVESLLIALVGGSIGLALGALLVSTGDPTGGALPVFFFPPRDLIIGAVLVVLLGLVAGIGPAVQALRLNPVQALRRE